jgi:preprotein translocase subunit SecG
MVSALSLIVFVLLHAAKGEGLGAIGVQARMFASHKGLEAGLNRLTGVAAGIFLFSSLLLGIVH